MLSHSPMIVTDGLALCLDAANPRSYPGSGSTWYDLCKNTDFTLYNTPTFNKNRLSFDGTNQRAASSSSFVLNGSDITISIGLYIHNTAQSCPCPGAGGFLNIDGGSYLNYLYFVHTGGNIFSISCDSQNTGSKNMYIISYASLLNRWHLITFTYNNSTYLSKSYLNGNYITQTTYSAELDMTGVISLAGYIKSCGHCYTEVDISFLTINRKEFTSDEVRRNYLATKSRFGL